MADEFVDFYEVLNLPLEAERKQISKRMNEVYLEAQRNLDHRNFQTRVKHQEMFELILPRARYILLDEGRRGEYDQVVKAFRAASAPAAPVSVPDAAPLTPPEHEKSFGVGDASSFRLAEESEARASGKAPPVEALPSPKLDPAQMAVQRDEMWAKWKSGLEAAIPHDDTEPKPGKPAPTKPVAAPVRPLASEAQSAGAPPKSRPAAAPISFDFGSDNAGRRGDRSPVPGAEELVEETKKRLSPQEIERVRTERKREAMKELLTTVGMKGALVGGLGAVLPTGALLIFLMGRYYPPESAAAAQLPVPSWLAWTVGIAIVAGATYFGATTLSKSMRHQASIEFSALPLEELLRKMGRSY